MRKQDIVIGGHYTAKVSGKLATVRVDRVNHEREPVIGTNRTRKTGRTTYDCTNLTTGMRCTFKSAAKFRERVENTEVEQCPDPLSTSRSRIVTAQTPTRSTGSTIPSSGDVEFIEIPECPPPVPDEDKDTARAEKTFRDIYARRDDKTGVLETFDQVIERVTDSLHQQYIDSKAPTSPTTTPIPEEDLTPTPEPPKGVVSATDGLGMGMNPCLDIPSPQELPSHIDGKPTGRTLRQDKKPSALGQRIAAQLEREKTAPTAMVAVTPPHRPGGSVPHVEVSALAGVGKTTLIIEGLKNIRGLPTRITPSPQQEAVWEQLRLGRSDKVRVSAYNTTITDNIKRLLGESGLDKMGVEARGVHGLGYSAVNKAFGRTEPNEYATHDLVAAVVGGEGADYRELRKEEGNATLMSAAVEVTSLCKMTLAEPTPEGIDAILGHHDIEVAGDVRARLYDVVPQALERSKAPKGRISFDDMLWLPLVLDLPLFKVDVQFIDESQDLNRAQQELIYRAGHRIVFVGDRRQAIYGFSGADSESMTRMGQTLASTPRGMVTMPLTVTRRCSKAVVDLARQIVPEFEAHPDNPAGRVTEALYPIPPRGNNYWTSGQRQERKWEETYGPLVQAGDLVMCRVNAPAVSQCYRFLKRHIPAQILGRKVGDGLVSLIERSKAETVVQLRGWLTDWLEKETALENAKKFPSEQRLIALQDKHDCVAVFCEGCNYPHEAIAKIKEVFTEKPDRRAVRFSSVHKAKGLESHRAFILMPDGAGMPHPMARTAWQVEQEWNCLYIAQTRAIDELVLVS